MPNLNSFGEKNLTPEMPPGMKKDYEESKKALNDKHQACFKNQEEIIKQKEKEEREIADMVKEQKKFIDTSDEKSKFIKFVKDLIEGSTMELVSLIKDTKKEFESNNIFPTDKKVKDKILEQLHKEFNYNKPGDKDESIDKYYDMERDLLNKIRYCTKILSAKAANIGNTFVEKSHPDNKE